MAKFGHDLDNTHADNVNAVRLLARREYGVEISEIQVIRGWSGTDTDSNPLTQRQIRELYEEAWRDWQSIGLVSPLIPGILNGLNDRGNSNVIVTASPTKDTIIADWYAMHHIRIDGIEQYVTSKDKINSGVDLLVDDHEGVAKLYRDSCRNVILLSRSWNADSEVARSVHPYSRTAKNWNEVGILLLQFDIAERNVRNLVRGGAMEYLRLPPARTRSRQR